MNKIEIHILHCGQVQVDEAIPFKEKTLNPLALAGLFRSPKHQLLLPVSAYLIKHPKGLVLIDTGWHTDVRKDQKKYIGWPHYEAFKAMLPENQAINEQLALMGILPKDIDYVVISHLDTDHVSGLHLVKEAKNILVSRQELDVANSRNFRYISKMWKGTKIKPFQFQQTGIGSQRCSFDLFGDGSVEFIHTPGHSKGLVTTKIERNDKFVILASDCGYAKKSWEEMILPGIYYNKKVMTQSLQWIKDMSLSNDCIEVIANHDPNVKPHIITL